MKGMSGYRSVTVGLHNEAPIHFEHYEEVVRVNVASGELTIIVRGEVQAQFVEGAWRYWFGSEGRI